MVEIGGSGAVGGRGRGRLGAALGAPLAFPLGRALEPLGDAEAADLAAGLVELAVR